MSKWSLQSPKVKKCQNNNLTNHEVLWLILELTKIRDLGMNWGIFMLRF